MKEHCDDGEHLLDKANPTFWSLLLRRDGAQ